MTPADALKLIKEKEAKFADLRFTDTIGKEQHVTIPTRLVDEGFSRKARCSTVHPLPVGGDQRVGHDF